jgi:hypothetical protein
LAGRGKWGKIKVVYRVIEFIGFVELETENSRVAGNVAEAAAAGDPTNPINPTNSMNPMDH